jgi:hypothetical protein
MQKAKAGACLFVESFLRVEAMRLCRVFSALVSTIGASGAGFENAAGWTAGGDAYVYECCGNRVKRGTRQYQEKRLRKGRPNIEEAYKGPVTYIKSVDTKQILYRGNQCIWRGKCTYSDRLSRTEMTGMRSW